MRLDKTMDTDHPFPVPMHRPFATLDDRWDKPLPVRRVLEIPGAESFIQEPITNKRGLQLTGQQGLSPFERLPPEIRVRIYGYLGYPLPGNIVIHECRYCPQVTLRKPLSIVFKEPYCWPELEPLSESQAPHQCSHDSWRYSEQLLCLNRSIRAEVTDLLFRHTTAQFSYPLTLKAIQYDNWHNVHTYNEFPGSRKIWRPRRKFLPMAVETYKFTHMRHVRLGHDNHNDRLSRAYEQPHPCLLSRKQRRRPLIRQAESIRLIANHCPCLRSLKLQQLPYSDKRRSKTSVSILMLALREVVRKCPDFEILGMEQEVRTYEPRVWGVSAILYYRWVSSWEDEVVNLASVPFYQREEVLEEWVIKMTRASSK